MGLALGPGWPVFLPPQSITSYCFIVALTALFPCFGIRRTNHPSNSHIPLSAPRRHPISHHLNHILYSLSSISESSVSCFFLVSFDFELCKMWMLPFFGLYQCCLSFVRPLVLPRDLQCGSVLLVRFLVHSYCLLSHVSPSFRPCSSPPQTRVTMCPGDLPPSRFSSPFLSLVNICNITAIHPVRALG